MASDTYTVSLPVASSPAIASIYLESSSPGASSWLCISVHQTTGKLHIKFVAARFAIDGRW